MDGREVGCANPALTGARRGDANQVISRWTVRGGRGGKQGVVVGGDQKHVSTSHCDSLKKKGIEVDAERGEKRRRRR